MSRKMTKQIRQLGRQVARRCFAKLRFAKLMETEIVTKRSIAFEPLETRQLMAADFFESAALAAEANGLNNYLSNAGSQVSTSTQSTAEGEAGQDLVSFAKSLRDAGVIFYGADWCAICAEQKRLFGDGEQFLNFQEVTRGDRTPDPNKSGANVSIYPTWEYTNGTRRTGLQTLAQISADSGIAIPTSSTPSIAPIGNTNVLRGSPLHIPVDAYDPNGNPLTITVISSNPSVVSAEVLAGNQSATIKTANFGDMVFELFGTEAERAASRFSTLANQGFYNTAGTNRMIFHRVIQNFVIQGGDPTGTGTGGSSLPDFDDQFNLNLQHNRSGILSYAKSSDDTNDSQFFVTAGPTRALDFNHSIFGQLVEGDATRRGIARTSVASGDKPINDVVIDSIEIFNDTENGLVRLKALGVAGGSSRITVTATDTEGNSTSQFFDVTIANDTSNGSPFLNDIPVINATAGQTTTYQLASQDKENDNRVYAATLTNGTNGQLPFNANSVSVNATTGLLTVTPPTNFVGSFQVRVSVRQAADADANDQFDTELVTVNVAPTSTTAAPTGLGLDAASDSGVSNTDNITGAGTLTFTVTGTIVGATVTLKAGTTTVGTAVATGTTTSITTANIAALGNGVRSITATQTVGSLESTTTVPLSLTFDATGPAALTTNPFPASIPAEQPFAVNLFHPEEGAGLVYSLVNAPVGMTVNPQTGEFSWTPTTAQIGVTTFSSRLTDTAGNATTTDYSITVAAAALGSVTVQLLNTSNNPITTVTVGQVFKVRLIARDLRPSGNGVGGVYADLNYNSAVVAVEGANPITRLNGFENGASGITTTLGLIDELGGFRASVPGAEPIAFVEVTFRATAAGQANFTTDAADTTGKDFVVFGSPQAVTLAKDRIAFGNASLAIGRNFTVVDDIFNFNEDTSNNTIDVLQNDTVVPGTNTVISIVSVGTPSSGGTVTIASDNRSVRYTPVGNYNGGETFTYTVRDNTGAEATGTVTVQVQPVNDPPIATPDSYTFIEGSTDNFLEVLRNDTTGVDSNETLSVSQVGTPSQGGTVRINGGANGILYTPRTGFVGDETFTYTLRDNNGGTTTTTVSVRVNPRVPPPVAGNDSFTVTEDAAAAEFNVLANDTPNVTGRALSVVSRTASQGGTVSATSDGLRLRYAPKANFSGTEIVTYTLQEASGSSATGTVTFTVTGVNDRPDAVADTQTVQSQPNQIINVLANDTDVDTGDVLTISAVTQPPTGQGTVTIQNNRIVYSAPNTDFTGSVTFTYTVSDSAGLTDTAIVSLTVQNFTPRSIGGQLQSSVTPQSFSALGSISGLTLNVSGTAFDGTRINQPTTANLRGDFSIPNLAPGTYNFSVPSLPFATNRASTATVQSAAADGNKMDLSLPIGNVQAKYIDIRDFTSATFNRGFMVAVTPGNTAQHWIAAYGAWRDFISLSATLNSDATTLTIRAANVSGQVFTGSIPISSASVRASEGNARLIRVLATPSQITLTPVANSSAASNFASESNVNDSVSNSSVANNSVASPNVQVNAPPEGEGQPSRARSVDAAMSQVNPSLEMSPSLVSTLANNSQGTNSDGFDSVYAQDLNEILKRRN